MSSVGSTSGPLSASAIVAPVVGSGSHILRIEGYSATKGLGKGRYMESEKFLAGGHRWCLRYYPDSFFYSHSSDSIYIALKRLDADPDEVEAKFTISLLDHAGNPVPSYTYTSHSHTFTGSLFDLSGFDFIETSVSGFNIIKRSVLEGSAYLNDDAFTVRCDVTVLKKVFTKTIPVSEALRGVVKQER